MPPTLAQADAARIPGIGRRLQHWHWCESRRQRRINVGVGQEFKQPTIEVFTI